MKFKKYHKKISLLVTIVFLVQTTIWAQTKNETKKTQLELDEVVISGNKFPEKKKNMAQMIDVINTKELKLLNAQTMADVLIQSGKVFVQKSQQGGGSPVIRGFEASRVLLMLDGVRMNNAIYRSGHLQNVITVDNNMLDRIEILNGPASTIYGSDALGGVVLMKTKDPKLTNRRIMELTQSDAMLRYSSVNNEGTVNAGFGFGNKNWGTLSYITLSKYGDLKQGGWDPNNQLANWGRKFYVERVNGKDSTIQNANQLLQKQSAYSQIDLLQKISFSPNIHNRHQLNFQYSSSTDIPRYDRLSETTSNGTPKNAVWYYGPQQRALVAYQYDYADKRELFDECMLNLSYQNNEESRNTRKFQKNDLQHRVEKLNVLGINLAARKLLRRHEISYGGDAQINFLKSTAEAEDITTGKKSAIDTRYPDGENNMNLLGVFAQHLYKFWGGKWVVNDGIRFNATSLRSSIDNNLFNLPFSEISQNQQALTANLGLIYFPMASVRIHTNASRGFRSPNIDDMAKIFESQGGNQLIVPNAKLQPEFTNNIDFGIQYQKDNIYFSTYGFYTTFRNAIVQDVFQYNGQDSVLYNGNMTKVYANQNKAKAYLYGTGFETKINFDSHLQFSANIAYTFGEFTQADQSVVPLDHIPPIYGRIGLRYAEKRWYVESNCLFNGNKKLVFYNPNGEDNLQYALPTGTPSWYTLNIKGGFPLNNHFTIQTGIDNILDRNYRHFASGISAPGRNFILSLRYKYE